MLVVPADAITLTVNDALALRPLVVPVASRVRAPGASWGTVARTVTDPALSALTVCQAAPSQVKLTASLAAKPPAVAVMFVPTAPLAGLTESAVGPTTGTFAGLAVPSALGRVAGYVAAVSVGT